ncbi:MAG: stalk domain-containing protein, partial [Bacillota bacterium]|nr:stalk domain-containing protein [Bacillota bacterium]
MSFRKGHSLTLVLSLFLILFLFQPLQASADTLKVVKSAAGDTLIIGANYTVEWSGHTGSRVYATLIIDGLGYTIGNTTAGKLTFVVPDLPTTSSRIYLLTYEGGDGGGDSTMSGEFSIKKLSSLPLQPIYPIDPIDPIVISPTPIDPIEPIDPNLINPILIDPTPIDPSVFMPKTPEDLEVVSVSADEISLAWTDKSATELGFTVERKTGEGSFNKIGETGVNVSTFSDETVSIGKTYTYRVQAFNIFGKSGYSNEVTAQIHAAHLPQLPIPVFPLPEPSVPAGETIVMHFYIDNPDYFINGALNTMDAAPTIFEGRTVLPIKYVAEPLGAAV